MSFWDKVAGAPVPAPPGPNYPQGYPQTIQQPVFVPAGYPQVPQQPQVADEEQQRIAAAMKRAPSSRSNMTCPDCGSGYINKPTPNSMEQCYECGWNPRFAHSTAGAGMPSTAETGPAQPTRQISTANNFNPQGIIGTVTL